MALNCKTDWVEQQVANKGFGYDLFGISDFGAAGLGLSTMPWTEPGSDADLNLLTRWRRRSLQVLPFGRGPAGAQPYGGKAKAYGLKELPWTQST